jgi:hypothetical protein
MGPCNKKSNPGRLPGLYDLLGQVILLLLQNSQPLYSS